MRHDALHAAFLALPIVLAGCGTSGGDGATGGGHGGGTTADPVTVRSLALSPLQEQKLYAPDGHTFLVNRGDATGVWQVWIGHDGDAALTCITDVQRSGGPSPTRFKMQAQWHPSGRWIVLAAERDDYAPSPFMDRNTQIGLLQSGIWTNMYAVTPDGLEWHRLTDFHSNQPGVADGFTGPAMTPDGRTAVWSQIIDGNILAYWPFGRWQLIRADIDLTSGAPVMANQRDITPAGMAWNEPGNFHPDGRRVLISGSTLADQQGMDQYTLDIATGELKNLTNSPTVWDEHGLFSPDGSAIIFMSAWPYRDDPSSSKVLTIKTEFMWMRSDGSGLTQLTHFLAPGFPESSPSHGIAAVGVWNRDGQGAHLSRLVFPEYEYWDIAFGAAEPAPPTSGG